MKTRVFRIAAIAASILFSACFIIPAIAHTFNDSIWAGALEPPAQSEPFSAVSDLLSADGTTVFLDLKNGTVDIPVTLTANGDVTGSLTVSVPAGQSIPAGKTFGASASSSSVTLTANVPSTVTVTLDTDVDPADYSGTDPVSLTFSVEFGIASESVTLSADFVMTVIADGGPATLDGEFDAAAVASNFADGVPIVIDVDGSAIVSFAADFDPIGDFPAHTEYFIGDDRYILYDGGTIPLYSAATVSINIPPLCAGESVKISSGGNIKILYPEPAIGELQDRVYFVLADGDPDTVDALALGIPYSWGDIEPDAVIERLEKDDGGLLGFTAAAELYCSAETGDEAQIVIPDGAPAGTYRASLKWTVSGVDLFSRELVFFVIRK